MNGRSAPKGAPTNTAGQRSFTDKGTRWIGPLSFRDGLRVVRLERRIAKMERRLTRLELRVDAFLASTEDGAR